MGKKSRASRAARHSAVGTDDPVGPRQPCPCGSGRRYKNCHGSRSGAAEAAPYVSRTFAGLPAECDWVAMREFVPAGYAPVTLTDQTVGGADTSDKTETGDEAADDGRRIRVATVLPGIAPALKRADGEVWLALQVAHQSGDPSRDFAEALRLAVDSEPGHSVTMPQLTGAGARLQDMIDPESEFQVTVEDGFDFWFEGVEDTDGSIAASLEQLNEAVHPTARLTQVSAAYWTSVGTKEHVRWVLPHEEEALLDALARLHAAGVDDLGPDTRLVGSFRAHGLLVPVWDLPVGTGVEAIEDPAAEFAERLGEALQDDRSLSEAERSARRGLANRQVTIR